MGLIQQYTQYRTVATGIFGDPNDLAATLIVGIALVLTRIKNAKGMRQAGYVVMLLTMLFTMALTESRGGMISLLIVIGAFFWVHVKNKSAAITAAVVIGSIFFVAGPARMTHFDSGEESANSRFHFWHNGFEMLKANPVTGVGFRSFKDRNNNKTAHNTFVLCFGELGLTGFFCWIGAIYYALLRRKKEQDLYEHTPEIEDDYRGARLALIGFLSAGFWISRLYSPILYVAMSLPAAHAVACMGEKLRPRYDWEEVAFDYKQIAKTCGIILLVIYALVVVLAR
jgi:O-antigen ligase